MPASENRQVPIDQLFRALPVVLLLGVVPGLALATLISPRLSWAERLAAAPGLSIGFVGVVGLVLHALGIWFSAPTVVPLLLLLVGAGLARMVRARRVAGVRRGVGWVVTAVAVTAGAGSVALSAVALHGEPLPAVNDAAIHGAVAASIARADDVMPVLPLPLIGMGTVRPRAAFEATDALASELGAGDPAQAMLPLAAVSLLALPLGVSLLAYQAVGDRRVAAAAAVLSFGFAFPASAIGIGDYPYIVDSTLIVPLILCGARLVRGEARLTNSLLAAVAVLSIWVTHGLELVTAAVVGAPLLLTLLVRGRGEAVRGLATGAAAAAAAVVAGYLLTRAPALPIPPVPPPQAYDHASAALVGHSKLDLAAVVDNFVTVDLSVLTGLLLLAGMVTVILRRRGRWLLLSMLIPLLCLLDIQGPELLHRIWLALYPWTEEDRLLGVEFFVVPLLTGIGAVALLDTVGKLLASTRMAAASHRRALVVVLVGVLAVGAVARGIAVSWDVLSWRLGVNVLATDQDVAVIQSLGGSLSPGSLVLNDGTVDAGQWITALTRDVEAEPKAYADAYPHDWRLSAVAAACTDPAAARRALQGVRAVFVGSEHAVGVPHLWNARCVAALPGVQLVAGSLSGPAGFVVARTAES